MPELVKSRLQVFAAPRAETDDDVTTPAIPERNSKLTGGFATLAQF